MDNKAELFQTKQEGVYRVDWLLWKMTPLTASSFGRQEFEEHFVSC